MKLAAQNPSEVQPLGFQGYNWDSGKV